MSEPFLGEIRLMSFGFAPRGWAQCNGQLLPISQNQGLFSLLGTTYGGDGRVNFALPDLRGRTPAHWNMNGGGFASSLGERGGELSHTLSIAEIPQHQHQAGVTNNPAVGDNPLNQVLGQGPNNIYAAMSSAAPMGNQSISNAGGSQAHNNAQPSLVINFCIALQGVYPSAT